jgi:hypothetical protein
MIKRKENLTDTIQVPLIKLVCDFKVALQEEDYEFCGRIKFEMDRRARVYGVNKRALRKILACIRKYPDNSSHTNKQYFDTMFEKYL